MPLCPLCCVKAPNGPIQKHTSSFAGVNPSMSKGQVGPGLRPQGLWGSATDMTQPNFTHKLPDLAGTRYSVGV